MSVFINQMLFSQEKLQSINFEKEKPEIIKFLKEFGTTTDAIKIQKYIAFPYFIGRHLCNPMVGEGGASIREMTKEEIKRISNCSCHNPQLFYANKQSYCAQFRDSLENKGISIMEFYYQKPENRTAYCAWVIKAYKFPIDFSKVDYSKNKYGIGYVDFEYKNQKGKMLAIWGLGFSAIDLIKVDNRYKITYVGYIYN